MPNNNNRYSTGLVNIVGRNRLSGLLPNQPSMPAQQTPMPSAPTLQYPQFGEIPDTTGQSYQGVSDSQQREYNAQVSIATSVGDRKKAEYLAKGAPERQSNLAGLFGTLSTVALQVYAKQQEIQAQKAEVKQAELEQQQAQGKLEARASLEQLFTEASGNIAQYAQDNGSFTTENDVRQVLQEYSWLPPDVQEEFYQFAGTQLRDITRATVSRQMTAADEVRNATISATTAVIQGNLSTVYAALSDGRMNSQQISQTMDETNQWLATQLRDYDPTVRMQILAPILEHLASTSENGSIAYQQAMQRMSDLNAAFQEVQQYRAQGFDQNPQQWQQIMWSLEAKYPGASGLLSQIPDALDIYSSMSTFQGHVRANAQAFSDEQSRARANQQANYDQIGRGAEIAFNMVQPGVVGVSLYTTINNKKPEDRTPEEAIALQIYQQHQTRVSQISSLQQELSTANGRLLELRRNFNSGDTPRTTVVTDPITRSATLVPVSDPDGNPVYPTDVPSIEEYNNLVERTLQIQAEIDNVMRQSNQSGININNPADRTFLDGILQETQQRQQQSDVTSSMPGVSGVAQTRAPIPTSPQGYLQRMSVPGFNWGIGEQPPGFPSGIPPVQTLARVNDASFGSVVMPMTANHSPTINSGYGVRTLNGESRNHDGLDIGSPDLYDTDVGAVSPNGGYVIAVEEQEGYGGTVMVVTPEGYVEQYSHLRAFNVRPGQMVSPGEPLGIIGGDPSDPMAGQSTGRHLHLQIWNKGVEDFTDPANNTVDPMTYLAHTQQYESSPSGVGNINTNSYGTNYVPTPNTVPLGNGNLIMGVDPNQFPRLASLLNNLDIPATAMYAPPDPMPQGLSSVHREDYPVQNDPNRDYGYEQIRSDPEFARALASAGDVLGIPAQWLADVIAYESAGTFDPGVQGVVLEDGDYAIGLIQAMVSTLNGMGLDPNVVANYSRAEYVRNVIIPYLSPFQGQINSIEDLYQSIFAGYISDPSDRAGLSDGYNTFRDIVRQFGNGVGRRYRTSYDDYQSSLFHTHETYQSECPICNQQRTRYNAIIPHEAIA